MAEVADRTRKPIMLVSLPAAGLANPMLVLAGELARRGVQDVIFASDEVRRADVEALTAASKIEFVSLGEQVPELSPTTWDEPTYRSVTQRSRFGAFRALLRHNMKPEITVDKHKQLEAAVEAHQPALMVIDVMCRHALDIAITKGIPYVLSCPFVASNIVSRTTPFGPSYTPDDFPTPRSALPYPMSAGQKLRNKLFQLRTLALFLTPSMGKRVQAAAKIGQELGVSAEARKPLAGFERAEKVLCYSLPDLDYPFDVPEKFSFVGAMVPPLPQAPADELTDWLDGHQNVVYMGFGTITRLTKSDVAALVEVARRVEGKAHVLWSLPKSQQPLLPADLPANLRVEGWVPSQLDVLAHPNVRVFVNHGGGNAFHESVYFGKPQVVRPLWVDCYDQAVRVQSMGLGLTVDRPAEINADDLTGKLLPVLGQKTYAEASQRFAAAMTKAGGRTAAADLLLSLPQLTETSNS
ncbi:MULTISPECIES: glycosyltransferase [unclassified Crossiella]|uniref:glycosyltransferase n=1 Tax=unclassified Crossiella TaxID=2620835 RepID=UPI001FFEFBA3|nr:MULTISPECIES: glycosyltransferase [unclassified Crossiella]MCK2241785.1 glycosyltransferase [Crossiella sp. S99.2]MCK2255343.1 glycosyltransferase [Crossiella sp. S99.1]